MSALVDAMSYGTHAVLVAAKEPPTGYTGRHRNNRPAPAGAVIWSPFYGMFRRIDNEGDYL